MPSRILLRVACVVLAFIAAAPAWSQRYPSERPVTLYVGFPPGGPGDITARTIADHFKRVTGQTMLVENRPGGNSLVALNALRQHKPDGYALALMGRSAMTAYWMQDGRIGFDPVDDLTYVCGIASTSFGLVARSDLPFRTLPELVAYAKANPGKLTFGTIGHGLWTHQPMVEFMAKAGIEMVHVPYKGEPEILNALAGGHLDLAVTSGSFTPLVQEGRLRLIAFLTDKRVPKYPNTPTFAEQGYPVKATVVVAIGGPKGLDPQIVAYLDDTFRAIASDPEFLTALDKIQQTPQYVAHDAITAWAKRQFAAERDIVDRFGLKAPAK